MPRIVVGTPSTDGEGSGWRRPRFNTNAVRGIRLSITRGMSPTALQSASAAGFCASTDSGPASIVKSPLRSVRISPPARGDASRI
jgi:hypothetical protein